jgi:hypothetical protein
MASVEYFVVRIIVKSFLVTTWCWFIHCEMFALQSYGVISNSLLLCYLFIDASELGE